jgi:DNA end-binding protein Ku
MRKTGRCALARWAARGKQYLVQLRPAEDGLIMQQLLYADEVRPMSEIEISPAPVKDAELKLAIQLIEQISADEFNPKEYEDDVRKRIEAAVETKVKGQEISISPSAPEGQSGGQVIDLMEALRASVGKAAGKRADSGAKAAERKPPKRATEATVPSRARVGRR